MFIIGIIFVVVGGLSVIYGILQNTILFMIFADVGAQLARFHSEAAYDTAWMIFGPGFSEMVIGVILIIVGIVFIIKGKKKQNHQVIKQNNNAVYIDNEKISDEDISNENLSNEDLSDEDISDET